MDGNVLEQAPLGNHSFSWTSLNNVFECSELTDRFHSLEERFNSQDETELFSRLVNSSTARRFPFHRWIRYREGYAGELVKEILRRYPLLPDSVVVDPMCGSGTTLVACNELGVRSFGFDVSPFAIAASRCKGFSLEPIQIDNLLKEAQAAIEKARKKNYPLSKFDEDISKYFEEANLQQLVNMKRVIRGRTESVCREILEFAVLAILEDCSNRKKDGNGLATRRTQISDCYGAFWKKVEMFASDYKDAPHSALSEAHIHDARHLDSLQLQEVFNSHDIGSIVFSPPYANSFDYFESYKLELVFMEWTDATMIHEKRKMLVRNYRIGRQANLESDLREVDLLCSEVERRIPEKEAEMGVRDGRTRLVPNMLRGYFADMTRIINSGMSRLLPGGHMHIVVDQSAYVGVPIPTDILIALIGENAGFEVVKMIECRRANTSGQQLRRYPYLRQLLRETIVTLRKR